jgi:glutamine amidotransferase PdxT
MEGSTQNFESNSFKTQCEIIIGVLAVQGSFYEHIDALKQLSDNVTSMHSKINESNNKNIKLKVVDIRSPKDVSSKMRGLIIPGILKFLKRISVQQYSNNVLYFRN